MIILVLMKLDVMQRERFERIAPEATFIYEHAKTVSKEVVQGADVILGNPQPEMLKDSINLKWLQTESAGVNQYTGEGILPEGVLLTNATGAYGMAVAEHMLGLLFMLFKQLHVARDQQSKQLWRNPGEMKYISNSTVLVVGLGDIGGEFAKMVKALGAYTIGIRRSNLDKPDYMDELYLMQDLEAQLSRADVVAISLPATAETEHLFDKKLLNQMKSDAIILNVGRGSVIVTQDLCEALESNQLGGVGLDVMDPEPLPENHPLWKYGNVVITPHCAGGSGRREIKQRLLQIWEQNLKNYLMNAPLQNIVDFKTGYRQS